MLDAIKDMLGTMGQGRMVWFSIDEKRGLLVEAGTDSQRITREVPANATEADVAALLGEIAATRAAERASNPLAYAPSRHDLRFFEKVKELKAAGKL